MEKIKSLFARISIAVLSAIVTVSFVAPVAKAQFSSNAAGLAGLIAVDNTVDGNGTDDLADLIVLGGLFPTSTNASQNARDLAGLIAVDNITGDGSGGAFNDNSDLADLIVLSGLFPTSRNASQNAKDLAGLIAVDNITGDGGSFGKGSDDLGDLIVLFNLFMDP